MEEPRHPRDRVHIKLPKRVCNCRLARWGFVSEGSKLREAGYGGSQCCELPPNLRNSRGEKERNLQVVVFFLSFIILLLLIWAVKSVAEELAKPPKKARTRPITTPTSPPSITTRLSLQSFKHLHTTESTGYGACKSKQATDPSPLPLELQSQPGYGCKA